MIISIYKNGEYVKSVQGNEEQCLSNVEKGETWEEITSFPCFSVQDSSTVKYDKDVAVSNIEIKYNGVVYQGDEISQNRMSRTINGMLDTDTIMWTAKNNSKVELTKEELIQILRLATIEQTKLW